MSRETVATARIALDNEIDKTDTLARSLKFQDAEENLLKVNQLYEHLAKVIGQTDQRTATHDRIIQNRRIKINSLSQDIKHGLQKREADKKEDGNIAFKCNWNDKNYQGICTEGAYQYNQIYGGPWCLYSKCRQFINLSTPPDNCCYESRALIDCNFGAGWNHGPNGKPISPRKIPSAKRGKIALLTTKPPYSQNRLLVGAFKITKLKEDPGQETFLYGDKETMLNDMLKYEIHFWNYHKNPRSPNSQAWATGLFRYISDIAILGILEKYLDEKRKERSDISKVESLITALKDSNTN